MDKATSKELFKRVKSWKEFLKLWSGFYSNEICVPLNNFVFTDKYGNNSKLVKTFQDITMMELICHNFQESSKGKQKAYFTGFTFSPIAYPLFIELNRHEGITAIMSNLRNIKETTGFSYFPYVTYSGWDENKEKYGQENRMYGNSATHLGIDFGPTYDLEYITECLNEDMQNVISTDTMCYITIVDANTSSPQFNLFKVIRKALKYVHMQNDLYKACDQGDNDSVIKIIEEMKLQNIFPAVQQTGYGIRSTSMLVCVVLNLLTLKDNKFRDVLNLLLKEITTLDVNVYHSLKSLTSHKFSQSEHNMVLKLLQSKLPAWETDI